MTAHQTELHRQNEAHIERRARLWGKPQITTAKAKIALPVEAPKPRPLVDLRYHVDLYHRHLEAMRNSFSLSGSFEASPATEYRPYQPEITFEFDRSKRSMKEIAMEVLREFPGVTFNDLIGKQRRRIYVIPRQIAMHRIITERRDISYPMVGRFFGGRDHTTVLHSVRKIEGMTPEQRAAL